MNTSSSLKAFASLPLISISKPTREALHNPKFSPKLQKIRCMHDHDSSFNFNAPLRTTTDDKLRLLVSEFRSLTEPIDRVKRLLNYAAVLAPLEDSARVPANRVTGCTTQVWLEMKMDDFGLMRFKADSDSEISKGFCSCLISILDGAKPEEVMGLRSEDLTEMNVGVHGKAHSRVNTWHNVLMSMQKRTMALVLADVSPPHDLDLLIKYMESSSDYSISLLPLYYDFTI